MILIYWVRREQRESFYRWCRWYDIFCCESQSLPSFWLVVTLAYEKDGVCVVVFFWWKRSMRMTFINTRSYMHMYSSTEPVLGNKRTTYNGPISTSGVVDISFVNVTSVNSPWELWRQHFESWTTRYLPESVTNKRSFRRRFVPNTEINDPPLLITQSRCLHYLSILAWMKC